MFFRAALAAAVVAIAGAQSCAPQMFFTNFLNTPDQLHIGWTTNCSVPDASVLVGTSPSSLTMSFAANNTQYKFASSPSYTSPFIHHAVASGLPLGTQIFYQVQGSASGPSAIMNVTTHPGVGADIPLRLAIIGDLGQTSNSADTLQHVMSSAAPFNGLLLVGDLSYADSYEPRWDSWQYLVEDVASALPFNTIAGNHEIELEATLQTFQAYNARFLMPSLNPGTPTERRDLYYGIRVGPVHLLALSTYSDTTSGSAQLAWLQQEVATIDRSVTPFVIAIVHAPMYNSNNAHQGDGEPMRETFEATLDAAGVDLVLAGHVHAYERNTRVVDKVADAAGPYYITIGDGGNREGLAATWIDPQPAISVFRQASYGHGEIEVVNATHLHWTWHQNPDLEPTIADDLWIVAGHPAVAHESEHAGARGTSEPRLRRRI